MSWNGSDQSTSAAPRSRGRTSPESGRGKPKYSRPTTADDGRNSASSVSSPSVSASVRRRLSVVLLAVVLAGAAVWHFTRPAPPPAPKAQGTKHKAQIAAVTPAPARTNAPAVAAEKKEENRNTLEWHKKHDPRYFVPPGSYRDEQGVLRTPTGRRILEALPSRFMSTQRSGEKRIFGSSAEEDIAKLILVKPGDPFMPGNYGPRFLRSFEKSLTQPTLVLESDSEETKALKRQVNEVKADLKGRLDAGEDIGEIMKSTEDELRALAVYKKDLMSEVKAYRMQENVSEKDFDDYVAAANVLLKERGMGEIKLPKIHEARLQQMRERYRERQAEKAARQTESAGESN